MIKLILLGIIYAVVTAICFVKNKTNRRFNKT